METVADYFWGYKITADGDCSHEVKRRLLLGRKVMISLDSIFGEGNGTPLQHSCLENPMDGSPRGPPCPWDSPGKNTGVGCHFLLQCMKGKSESEVAQSYPILSDPMDCSLPGSSIHGIFQVRVLEWGAIAFNMDPPNQASLDKVIVLIS